MSNGERVDVALRTQEFKIQTKVGAARKRQRPPPPRPQRLAQNTNTPNTRPAQTTAITTRTKIVAVKQAGQCLRVEIGDIVGSARRCRVNVNNHVARPAFAAQLNRGVITDQVGSVFITLNALRPLPFPTAVPDPTLASGRYLGTLPQGWHTGWHTKEAEVRRWFAPAFFLPNNTARPTCLAGVGGRGDGT